MTILMVKKILPDGSPCAKCAQVEALLRKRGYWDRIDRVIYAEEVNKNSEATLLADKYGITVAPFFLVRHKNLPEKVYSKVFELIKKEFEGEKESSAPKEKEGQGKLLDFDIAAAALRYKKMEADEILTEAQKIFGGKLALAFSGAEDVILIDMAAKNGLPFHVFCLDTGRLHNETYSYFDVVREHYAIDIALYTPSYTLLEPFLKLKGLNSFYKEGHQECCRIRKVEPLKRALHKRRAWVTGQREDQNPQTRHDLLPVHVDQVHSPDPSQPIIKFNPLINWTSDRVWQYIREKRVPYNPLHDQGYRSIGCAPCTRASRPGEHEREARWWWEQEEQRECGLHVK